jgi:predicted glycoside hydrolase/deacetylase ChbG (UPF0249 family)
MLVIHADDYGLNEDVSMAITCLARRNRLSSFSVMTTTDWSKANLHNLKGELSGYKGSIGVHVSLTDAPAASKQFRKISHDKIHLLSYKELNKRLKNKSITDEMLFNEIRMQIERLVKIMNVDFIDFHHGLHLKSSRVARVVIQVASLYGISCVRGGKAIFYNPGLSRRIHELYYNMKISGSLNILKGALQMNEFMIVDPGSDSVVNILKDQEFTKKCIDSTDRYVVVVHPSISDNLSSNRSTGRVEEYEFLNEDSNMTLTSQLMKLC